MGRLKSYNKEKSYPEEKEDCMTDPSMIPIWKGMRCGGCLILRKPRSNCFSILWMLRRNCSCNPNGLFMHSDKESSLSTTGSQRTDNMFSKTIILANSFSMNTETPHITVKIFPIMTMKIKNISDQKWEK